MKPVMPISSRLVLGSTFASLIVGFFALLAIVGANFWLSQRAEQLFGQQIEERDSRAAAVELRSALQSAESSQRGYLITGNEIYLAPYGVAKTQAQRQLAALGQLLAPHAESTAPMQRLTSLVADKFDELEQTITLKRGRHDDEAMALILSNKGKALMDEANVFFAGIISQADDRMTAAAVEQQANANWLRLVSAVGALVIVLVIGAAGFLLYRYTRELQQARDEVGSLNDALEQRVLQRTADLARARDRAEVLLREVNHRVANSLSLVSSLVSLQSKAFRDETVRQALAETQDRIFAISLVHRRLYGGDDAREVTLDAYLSGLLDHLQTSLRREGQGATLSYTLEPIALSTDTTVNLGVIVTEWVTNAFKYAYPGAPGEIRVRGRKLPDGEVELVVEDDGVGHAEGAPAKGTGLGSRIVSAMASSLGGEVQYLQRSPGMGARLTFRPQEAVAL
jgi:two-component sensor histidine kinase/CHASE3 domain sensor protein